MNSVNVSPLIVEGAVSEPGPRRAERLLGAMHQVISHDLPNQLVAVLSLAYLMESEEIAALSPQAQEYLNRLRGAARRAAGMVQFLKQMAGLNGRQEPLENIQLAPLAREIRAEVNQLYPGRTFVYELQWEGAAVCAGRRSFQQACVEVLRCGVEWHPEAALCLRLGSDDQDAAVEVTLAVAPQGKAGLPPSPPLRPEKPTTANRLELRLAQELVATWGGMLEVPAASPCFLVRLLCPKR